MDRLFYSVNSLLLAVSCVSLLSFIHYPFLISMFIMAGFLMIGGWILIKKKKQYRIKKRFLLLNLGMITAISLLSLMEVIHLFVENNNISVIRLLPLMICTLALYGCYWVIEAANHVEREVKSVTELVTYILSGPSIILALIMAIPLTVFILLLLTNMSMINVDILVIKLTQRGLIPPLTLLIFIWGVVLLANKFVLLSIEKNAFDVNKKKSYILRAFKLIIDNEVNGAERNYESKLDFFSVLIWKTSNDFYTLPRYINWAIPILGFIGTVLGISMAADGIQKIIGEQKSVIAMSDNLGAAISPLGIAFDTTLIALSLSVLLVLIQTFLQRFESGLLVDMENDIRHKYCYKTDTWL